MADIVEDLADLHRQATHERSHNYVAATALRAIREIEDVRKQRDEWKNKWVALAQAALVTGR